MKILIVSTFIPPIAGGAEQVVWETAKRLAKYKDAEIHILTTGKEGLENKEGIIIHKVPNLFGKEVYYSTLGWFKIKNILYQNKFDIIHIHIALPWSFIFRKIQIKKIITCHGSDVYPIDKLIRKYFVKSALKNSDLITAPSKWLSNYIENNYNLKSKTIPNGIDTNKFKPIKKIKQRKNVVLFVGRYVKRKGIIELLKVANELLEYEFWFVGKGKLENKIKGKNINNLGFKTGDELVKLYNQATICVFPSHWENLPMTGLEAMACGKTIIATKKGFSEIIENNKEGIIIDPKNKEQLKNSIKQLMENHKLRKIFEKNSRKKSLKYDWDKIVKKYYNLYKSINKT